MITKNIKKICKEDPSLIENYDKAIEDNTQVWECHHRKETELGLRPSDLIRMKMYYYRPANELIFLTSSEHMKLHGKDIGNGLKGKPKSTEHKKKLSDSVKKFFENEENKEKWLQSILNSEKKKEVMQSDWYRKKMSKSLSGENNPMYGKQHPSTGKHRVYDESGKFHYEF